MKRGILLIAVGHPYYGKMAAALAATLKATGSELPVHLAFSESAVTHLSVEEKNLFNSMELVSEKCYTPAYIRVKMHMYELSPFDETLYLDVDMVWFKRKPELLFEELKDCSLTYSNFGPATGPNLWANYDEVRTAYNLGEAKLYQMHSEFVYFKRCKEVNHFFKTAKKTYDTIKVKSTVFAGGIPDELPFAIASALTAMYPHQDKFRPIWWRSAERKGTLISDLYRGFYALSMGGNVNDQFTTDAYNTLSSAAYYKLKLPFPFKWKAKKHFLPERALI